MQLIDEQQFLLTNSNSVIEERVQHGERLNIDESYLPL